MTDTAKKASIDTIAVDRVAVAVVAHLTTAISTLIRSPDSAAALVAAWEDSTSGVHMRSSKSSSALEIFSIFSVSFDFGIL